MRTFLGLLSKMICFDVTKLLCVLHYIQSSDVNVGMKGAQTPTLEQNLSPLMEQCVKDGINNIHIRIPSKIGHRVDLAV